MTDIFICHIAEDRVARERLAEALTLVGLAVTWETGPDENHEPRYQPDRIMEAARATIVLWSKGSITDETHRAHAAHAFSLKAQGGSADLPRYVGIIVDDTGVSRLVVPFKDLPAQNWGTWFANAEIDFADQRFIALLTTLESLTSHSRLVATGRALADRDLDLRKLRLALQARDAAVATVTSEKESLELALAKSRSAVAASEHLVSEKQTLISTLEKTCATLSARADTLENSLQSETAALEVLRAELAKNEAKAAELSVAQIALTRDLDDARAGLSAALRQHKTLQGQIDASDQVIREVMTQREGLISRRDSLERECEKLTLQLADTSTRLSDSDSRRMTYESALVDRTKEIHSLEDRVASLSGELGTVKPKVDALASTVKDWGHVPWRSIAASSIVLGAFGSYVFITGREALDSWLTPPQSTISQASPVVASPPSNPEHLKPKTEAKINPDTLPDDGNGLPDSFDVRDATNPSNGVIPVPSEQDPPSFNDQVQFNPDGLPPVDTDSRPPPQDLPPMQQKPKLILKPLPPATIER